MVDNEWKPMQLPHAAGGLTHSGLSVDDGPHRLELNTFNHRLSMPPMPSLLQTMCLKSQWQILLRRQR